MVNPPRSRPNTVGTPGIAGLRAKALRPLGSWRDPLIRNAYVLTLSALGTALFGAAYWALAAHKYNADAVGRNYAAVSVMMLVGGIGQVNLANVMIRFVPSAGPRTGRLVGRAYLAAAVTTLLLAAGLILLIPEISPGLEFLHTAVLGSCFAVATAGYAIFNLQDGVLTGLRRPAWVALENWVFSVLKIALLAALAALGVVDGILVSWMVGLVPVLVLTNAFVFGRAIPRHRNRPAQAHTETSTVTAGYIAADYAGALCWLIAINLPPVIILNRLGPADSAYFSLAWLVAFTLYYFSSNMGYSLVVEATNNVEQLAQYRRLLRHAGSVLTAVVVPLVIVAPWLLRFFGPDYASHGTLALRLLAISALPNLLNTTAVAMSRIRRRMKVVVGLLAVLAALVIALTLLLVPRMGIDGAATAWLSAQCVVAGALVWHSSWWLPGTGPGTAVRRPAPRARRHEPAMHRATPLVTPAFLCWLPDRFTARRLARQVFPHADHVKTRSARRTPGGLLVVRLDGDAHGSVAVKHPLNPRAAQMLRQERRVLRQMADDERLDRVRRLLPSEITCQLDEPLPLIAETWLRGMDASTALRRNPQATSRVTIASLAAIGELHQATGRSERATAHIRQWVDARVAVLSKEIGWCRREAGAARLEALRQRLYHGLADRTMTVGWTHGDFAAGNILLAEDCTAVTGVIDWSTACSDGPVDIDAYTLVLTLQHELSGQTLGRVIADIVRSGRLPPAQHRLLGGIGSADPDVMVLPLLSWLWHVANNASESPRYGLSVRWVPGNIVPVLEAVSP